MPEFGEIMAELRQDKGMTQKELAVKLFVGKSTISNYETGQRRAHTDFICKVADILDVSTDYLLGRVETRRSFSITSEDYVEGTTVGAVLEQMLELDDEHRHLLCKILNDFALCSKKENHK